VTTTTQQTPSPFVFAEALKSWGMVILTFVFVALYGLALIGKLKPLADASMVSRIEPIIFVIIGYYFGRLPAQQNEKTLKEEIGRQTQKADAAQHAKEQALQSREALEEKLKSVSAVLNTAPTSVREITENSDKSGMGQNGFRVLMSAVLQIVNS